MEGVVMGCISPMDGRNIPSKIVANILVRLNSKTLSRCKCVCKAWFILISTPFFQDWHYLKWQRNIRILFRSPASFNDFPPASFSCVFASLHMNLPHRPAIRTTFTARVDGPIKLMIPSCWGLVCFATQARVYLYNPATRRLVALPPSPSSESTMCGFGFGYIQSRKCFKVVRFMYKESTDQRIECSVLQVDRGGAKDSKLYCWRVLKQACPYFVDEFSLPVFSEQTIYWKIHRNRNRNQNRRTGNHEIILAFNIEECKFSEISYPSSWKYSRENWTQLMNFEGMLSVVQNFTSHIEIWIAKRNQEWHPGRVIDFEWIGIDIRQVVEIMYINKDGLIILASMDGHVHLCDINKRRSRTLLHQTPFTVHGLAVYSESLFPLGHSQ